MPSTVLEQEIKLITTLRLKSICILGFTALKEYVHTHYLYFPPRAIAPRLRSNAPTASNDWYTFSALSICSLAMLSLLLLTVVLHSLSFTSKLYCFP